jgi:succinate dehydrogenase / fumarate reductase cytochrome b subunit
MTPVQRPLSPHLQVYRPQLTSLLSITHRATGMALSVGAVFLVWWLVSVAGGPDYYARTQWFFGSWLGVIFLLGWCFSLFYHLCNGIRHMFWDTGRGFDLPTLYASGWTMLAVSTVLTLITWVIAFTTWVHS